jgi:hypothetical protein
MWSSFFGGQDRPSVIPVTPRSAPAEGYPSGEIRHPLSPPRVPEVSIWCYPGRITCTVIPKFQLIPGPPLLLVARSCPECHAATPSAVFHVPIPQCPTKVSHLHRNHSYLAVDGRSFQGYSGTPHCSALHWLEIQVLPRTGDPKIQG